MSSAADPAIGMVTPTLDVDIVPTYCRGVYVAVAGDLAVVMSDGTTGTIPAVAAGLVHPFRIKRILSVGTTATGIRVFY